MKNIKIFTTCIFTLTILMSFQNCSKPVPLAYKQQSSAVLEIDEVAEELSLEEVFRIVDFSNKINGEWTSSCVTNSNNTLFNILRTRSYSQKNGGSINQFSILEKTQYYLKSNNVGVCERPSYSEILEYTMTLGEELDVSNFERNIDLSLETLNLRPDSADMTQAMILSSMCGVKTYILNEFTPIALPSNCAKSKIATKVKFSENALFVGELDGQDQRESTERPLDYDLLFTFARPSLIEDIEVPTLPPPPVAPACTRGSFFAPNGQSSEGAGRTAYSVCNCGYTVSSNSGGILYTCKTSR